MQTILTLIMIWYILLISSSFILAYKWFREPYYAQFRQQVSWGIIFRLQSFWIGIHHSKYMGRTCINLLPCITIWIGNKPTNI